MIELNCQSSSKKDQKQVKNLLNLLNFFFYLVNEINKSLNPKYNIFCPLLKSIINIGIKKNIIE